MQWQWANVSAKKERTKGVALRLNRIGKGNLMNTQQQPEENNTERFESDAKKLADRHLADKDHVITDEDMQNIRVGMSPGADAPTQQAVEDAEDRIADKKVDSEDDTLPGAQKATPWDLTA